MMYFVLRTPYREPFLYKQPNELNKVNYLMWIINYTDCLKSFYITDLIGLSDGLILRSSQFFFLKFSVFIRRN